MNCNFVVGQRVVAINEVGWYPLGGGPQVPGPKKDDICKILEIMPSLFTYPDGSPIIALRLAGWDGGYSSRSFRPLNEKPQETSIEVFKKLLTPNKKALEKA